MNFKEIVKKNRENVQSIIKLITKEENEDLEQEVYIRVWKNSKNYSEQGNFKSWINTIAKNISKDYLKSAYRKNSQNSTSDEITLNTLKDKKETPELKVIKNERQTQIINAINSLKPKFKEVIMLCEIQGYSYEDCARKLKCPLGTVKSRIYNAKKELAEKLKDLIKERMD